MGKCLLFVEVPQTEESDGTERDFNKFISRVRQELWLGLTGT